MLLLLHNPDLIVSSIIHENKIHGSTVLSIIQFFSYNGTYYTMFPFPSNDICSSNEIPEKSRNLYVLFSIAIFYFCLTVTNDFGRLNHMPTLIATGADADATSAIYSGWYLRGWWSLEEWFAGWGDCRMISWG